MTTDPASRRRAIRVGLLLWAGLSACRSTGGLQGEGDRTRVWPAPPETARVAYVGAIAGEDDLARRRLPTWVEVLFGRKPGGGLVAPNAVTATPDGRLYVADREAGVVHLFNLSTRRHRRFGQAELASPVALLRVDREILVVDSLRHEVCVFAPDGTWQRSFGATQLRRPAGIAVTRGGEVIVADAAAHRLQVFGPEGSFRRSLGGRGAGPGQFNFPTHLWIDGADRLYVCDTLNYRIQVLTPQGRFLRSLGRHGDRPGCFGHPAGVAVDRRGHVLVVDRQFENVQIFDAAGNILLALGGEGRAPGEFWLPSGLFVDARDRVYVADTYNRRIQIFRLLETPQP